MCAGITIGKRYARTDELGVPFAVTVDFDTVRAGALLDTVTLRERDTMEQVRVPTGDLVGVLKGLCETHEGAVVWADVRSKYPLQAAPAEE
jgi:glycyl-tRNA synthetase